MKLAIALAGMVVASSAMQDTLAFVYEAVRHGARAPQNHEEPWPFHVPTAMLTGQGMRQRYLLGRRNRQRYAEQFALIDGTFNPSQVWVESTNVYRVIQSTYSELLGLFPYKQTDANLSNKVLPPMKARNVTYTATIDGLTMVPVYNFAKPSLYDDLMWQSCHYAAGNRGYKSVHESSFSDVSPYVLSVMKRPMQEAFNLSDTSSLNYSAFYYYSDTMLAEVYEGIPKRYPFSEL